MKLNDYMKVKREVEQLQREVDRSAGALAQLKKRLKNEFGCRSIKEAKKLLKRLEREEYDAEEAFNEKFIKFKRAWKDRTGG